MHSSEVRFIALSRDLTFALTHHFVFAWNQQKHSVLELVKTSLREEGIRFLFKGWTPAFVRLAPNTILMFVFMEVRAAHTTFDFLLHLTLSPEPNAT